MTESELIKWIDNDVTMSGAININVSEQEIKRVIENSTLEVRDLYREAVVTKYTIVPVGLFYTPEFKNTRTLRFPGCVRYVTKVEEMKPRSMMWGINDPDISFNKAFVADLWTSPMCSDTVAFRTIQWLSWDQMKNFILTDIQHEWNRYTHTLLMKGHDPTSNVYIEFTEGVPDEDLWNDAFVRKYLSARVKLQVAKQIGTFTTQLIGGVTINYNLYTDEAKADIEDCKKYWDGLNNSDWFLAFP